MRQIRAVAIGLLLLLSHRAAGQTGERGFVRGIILDAETDMPLPGAHVFYRDTTIGDISDADGRFVLKAPPFDTGYLIVSMLGYEVSSTDIRNLGPDQSAETPFVVRLTPVVLNLGEITVEAEMDRAFRRDLRRFRELLFSTTDFGRHGAIENPEVLAFSEEESPVTLTVRSSAPLRLSNPDLGYDLLIHGLYFNGNEWSYRFKGQIQYVEMEPESPRQEAEWKENRLKAYRGSMRHFLESLVQGRLRDAGFEVFHVGHEGQTSRSVPVVEMKAEPSETRGRIISASGDSDVHLLTLSDILFVVYTEETQGTAYERYVQSYAPGARGGVTESGIGKYQMSWLEAPTGMAMIDNAGRVYAGAGEYPLIHYGYWAWERFGEKLPADYNPDAR